INLAPTQKHIPEILKATGQCYSIGFKLESNVDLEQLLEKASSQISRYSMDAVVANRLEDIDNPNSPRAWLLDSDGKSSEIPDLTSLCEIIESLMAN
ncbi:MAG: phosphopantothenoylcysteine decarboxylase, partial [Candidatus Thermoplasmatota archaeon]|nr:phosphopantothenoylcysteine decarboxylase [Candidatus Thermoplasmatota archaeon]